MMSAMRCNTCRRELEGEDAVATPCHHLFCTEHATAIIENAAPCPCCGTILADQDMHVVHIGGQSDAFKYYLFGLRPEQIQHAANNAIKFYIEQRDVPMKWRESQLVQQKDHVKAKAMAKLTQIHDAYRKAKSQCRDLMEAKTSLERDKMELQEKYAEKARQKRRLEESMMNQGQPMPNGPATPLQQMNRQVVHGNGQPVDYRGGGGPQSGAQQHFQTVSAGFQGGPHMARFKQTSMQVNFRQAQPRNQDFGGRANANYGGQNFLPQTSPYPNQRPARPTASFNSDSPTIPHPHFTSSGGPPPQLQRVLNGRHAHGGTNSMHRPN